MSNNNTIHVIDRTFDVLEMLATSSEPIRSTDIADRLGVSLQTINNLLRTLYQRGYVSQDSSRSYRLGPQCFYLGSFADRWQHTRNIIAPQLREMVKASGLTGFVGVIENDRLLSVAKISPENMTVTPPEQSWWEELHSTASGRLLLAFLPDKERAKIFARNSRKKITGSTIIDADKLDNICKKVAEAGYCQIRDESREGVSSLAIPLHDINGKVFAALALSGKNEKWCQIHTAEKLQLLKDAAAKMERN